MPASAPRTWAITDGGAVTATTKSFTLEDLTERGSLTCKSAVVKAKPKSGKHLAGANAGTVTSADVTGWAFESLPVAIKGGHLPWYLNLVSYSFAKGVTTGTLTGRHLSVAAPTIGCTTV